MTVVLWASVVKRFFGGTIPALVNMNKDYVKNKIVYDEHTSGLAQHARNFDDSWFGGSPAELVHGSLHAR